MKPGTRIAIIRSFLPFIFIFFLFRQNTKVSLIIFLFFVLLGVIESMLEERSNFNPLIDKIFLLSSFIILTTKFGFPKLIVFIAGIREVLITIGWFASYQLWPDEKLGYEPTTIGKFYCFLQFIVIFLYLFGRVDSSLSFITSIMAIFGMASFVNYLVGKKE